MVERLCFSIAAIERKHLYSVTVECLFVDKSPGKQNDELLWKLYTKTYMTDRTHPLVLNDVISSACHSFEAFHEAKILSVEMNE